MDEPNSVTEEKALRARLEAARNRREASSKKTDLEALARQAEHEEALADLEEKHGPLYPRGTRIARLDVGPHMFVVRRGLEVLFRKFSRDAEQSVARKKPLSDAAIDQFVLPCVVYPENADEVFAECPGAKLQLCLLLQELYGVKVREDEGK
jgi:hypothetical protein